MRDRDRVCLQVCHGACLPGRRLVRVAFATLAIRDAGGVLQSCMPFVRLSRHRTCFWNMLRRRKHKGCSVCVPFVLGPLLIRTKSILVCKSLRKVFDLLRNATPFSCPKLAGSNRKCLQNNQAGVKLTCAWLDGWFKRNHELHGCIVCSGVTDEGAGVPAGKM